MATPERKIQFGNNSDMTLLSTNVGGGKRTFFRATLAEINRVGATAQVIEPGNGNVLTRQTWNLMRRAYELAGKPGRFQEWVGSARTKSDTSLKEQVILYLANREVLEAASDAQKPVVSFHGMFGMGLERFLVDGDVVPEPRGIDAKTTILVPTKSAKDKVKALGDPHAIEEVGFYMPGELLGNERIERIKKRFENGFPTSDDPLRMAVLMTGQLAHMDKLYGDVMRDPIVYQWIKSGRLKLDVYLWNGRKQANEAFELAKELSLHTIITNEYQPDREYDIQLYWNNNANKAIDDSFAIMENAEIFITPPAERTPFAATTYPIFWEPVKGNAKMEGNMHWLQQHGIAGPESRTAHLGYTLKSLFDNTGAIVREHFDRADEVFEEGKLLQGAAKTVAIVLER